MLLTNIDPHIWGIDEWGERRFAFTVDVDLGEHATAEGVLATRPQEVDHLRQKGRESKADTLQGKLYRPQELMGEEDG